MTDARTLTDRQGLGPFLWPRLGVKYYPHADESVFEEFSVAERLLRPSSAFSEHRVPAPASYGQIHPSFFGVGLIECAIRQDGALVWMSLRAPDRWVEIHEAGSTLPRVGGDTVQCVPPVGHDCRSVPAASHGE